jgi:hypothetical protein
MLKRVLEIRTVEDNEIINAQADALVCSKCLDDNTHDVTPDAEEVDAPDTECEYDRHV